MGLFGTIAKGVSAAAKGFTSVVKTVASGISTAAKSIGSAIFGKGGVVSTAYNKVKSIGSMALGMLFPDASGDTIRSLQSVTSSAQAVGSTDFVNTFGNSLISASAQSGNKSIFRTITDKIVDGLKWVGGKASDGAKYIYEKTMKFIGQDPTTQAKVADPAKSIVTEAKEAAMVAPRTDYQKIADQTVKLKQATTGFHVSDSIYDAGNGLGVGSLIAKPQIPLSLAEQPLNLQYDAALAAGMGKDVVDTSRKLGISPFAGAVQAQRVMDKGLVGSGLMPKDLPKAPEPIIRTSYNRGKSSILDKILGAAKTYGPDLLEGFGAGLNNPLFPEVPYRASGGITPGMENANRMGVGGRGAAGGAFLDEAQRAFFAQQKSRIEQLG